MATVLNTVYPPIVETFMPAFLYTESARVYFSLSSFTSPEKIKYIHVAISNQKTNKNVLIGIGDEEVSIENSPFVENRIVRPTVLPIKFNSLKDDATSDRITSEVCYSAEKDMYFFEIPTEVLDGGEWIPDQFYKVQIRFQIEGADDPTSYYGIGNTGIGEGAPKIDLAAFNSYLLDNAAYFSEWSTVCLLRPIYIPDIYSISTEGGYTKGVAKFNGTNARPGECPVFPIGELRIVGTLLFKKKDSTIEEIGISTSEKLSGYKVYITDEDGNIVNDLATNYLYSADTENINEINTTFDITGLDIYENSELRNRIPYYLNIDVETNNGYTFSRTWLFKLSDHEESTPWTMWPVIDDLNGNITIFIRQNDYIYDGDGKLSTNCTKEGKTINSLASNWGLLHVKRASSKTNFSKWEKIKTYRIGKNRAKDEKGNYKQTNMVFIDNTAESLTGYRYRIQFENANQYMYKSVGIKIDYDTKVVEPLPIDSNLMDNWKLDAEKEFTYMPKFYGAIFSRNDRQLRLGFDFKVNSITPTVSRVKVDTLGGKYPKFAENGILNYKQFSIAGTISSQDDNGKEVYDNGYLNVSDIRETNLEETKIKYFEEFGTFFTSKVLEKDVDANLTENTYKEPLQSETQYEDIAIEDIDVYNHRYYGVENTEKTLTPDGGKQEGKTCLGNISKENQIGSKFYKYYYETEFCDKHGNILELSDTEATVARHYKRWDNDLPNKDYMWEREFREAVMGWLNDGEPKLMRTMTEGNAVVMLTDVSLSPIESTSRRLYSFQANAYEVADSKSLATLHSLGIYNIIESEFDKNDKETGTYEPLEKIYNAIDFSEENNSADNSSIVSYTKNAINRTLNNSSGDKFNKAISTSNAPLYLTDIKVKFKSAPHVYDANGNILSMTNNNSDGTETTDAEKADFVGYRVAVKTSVNENDKTIFYVDRRGYFQLPSKYKIYELSFPDMKNNGDVVDVWYVANFRLVDTNSNYSQDYLGRYIIAQEGGWVYPGTDLSKEIFNRYNLITYKDDETTKITRKESQEFLNYWQGIFLEANPYSVFNVAYKSSHDDEWTKSASSVLSGREDYKEDRIYMNESGHLNLQNPNFEIVKFEVVGRRFFNADRQSKLLYKPSGTTSTSYSGSNNYLRENDFVCLDGSTGHQHIYKKDEQWYMDWNGKTYEVEGSFTEAPDVITVKMPIDMLLTYEGQIYRQVFE